MTRYRLQIYVSFVVLGIHGSSTVLGFVPCCLKSLGTSDSTSAPSSSSLYLQQERSSPTNGTPKTSSYQDTDATSQGIVSSLTDLVNLWSNLQSQDSSTPQELSAASPPPPRTVAELQQRLAQDYSQNNYLWTGQLDLACFEPTCRFTDPTLTFEGTRTYQTNVQNLVPWVERYVQNSQSILLDMMVTSEYIETRWNMVGELNTLFWKPKIDVIGRTKFWFRTNNSNNNNNNNDPDEKFLQIYEYDEKWEIPAYQALLQLVTPAGTFSNSQQQQ